MVCTMVCNIILCTLVASSQSTSISIVEHIIVGHSHHLPMEVRYERYLPTFALSQYSKILNPTLKSENSPVHHKLRSIGKEWEVNSARCRWNNRNNHENGNNGNATTTHWMYVLYWSRLKGCNYSFTLTSIRSYLDNAAASATTIRTHHLHRFAPIFITETEKIENTILFINIKTRHDGIRSRISRCSACIVVNIRHAIACFIIAPPFFAVKWKPEQTSLKLKLSAA